MFFVLARMASLMLALVVTPLSLLLLFVGQSFESVLFGIAGVMIGLSPLLVFIGIEIDRLWPQWAGGLGCLCWAGLTVWLVMLAPDGHLPEGARIQHRYTEGKWGFQRQALGNLLPELDQFLLGFKVVPLIDRYFTFEQSRKVSGWTAEIYRELEADADFHALGSVMPHAYSDLWFSRSGQGHSFLYVPPGLRRDVPAPVLVFLHGSGGNFKAYPWLLSQIADELGFVLICPSYGMGDWTSADSSKVVDAALADAKKVVKLDGGKMHLMGLSNGGKGLGHVGRDVGEKFVSLTFISPVFEVRSLINPLFIKNWQDKSIHIITGAEDDRVPVQSVRDGANLMKANGGQVTLRIVPEADHFLLFSHRQAVIAQLKEWLEVSGLKVREN